MKTTLFNCVLLAMEVYGFAFHPGWSTFIGAIIVAGCVGFSFRGHLDRHLDRA